MTTRTSPVTDLDLHLLGEGTHRHLHRVLGANPVDDDTTWFAVWAPNANEVVVIGDQCDWDPERATPLHPRASSGIWEGAAPVRVGQRYKYRINGRDGRWHDKADPVATAAEEPPATASIVWSLDHRWEDDEWMAGRGQRQGFDQPISIYEVHAGSWMPSPDPDRPFPTYRELAVALADHLEGTGFTHVEFLPLTEHPFYGSWGYQVTGYFAPTARYGTPDDFAWMVDHLHQRGFGVICDWVPSHFPDDGHGLVWFDGTALYEHLDPRLGHHPDWDSKIFNYGRNEVRAFLLSSAICLLDRYHIDGLRVDAVASLLYRDYSRREGEWIPNEYGGRENLEAIGLLRDLTDAVRRHHPGALTIAEESTAWPGVTDATNRGGLGFDYKWDMGWMHDTLQYLSREPIHRRWHHGEITFRGVYAFSERFVLPLSHDEVVHGKGSLLAKMPGDDWQRLANLRLLLAYQWTTPGRKLLFMGGELAVESEWNHDVSLDPASFTGDASAGIRALVADLNREYRGRPALHALDLDPAGFAWLSADDAENSVLSWLRLGPDGETLVVVANFTPVVRHNHRLGVPRAGVWRPVLSTDERRYGGSGVEIGPSLATVPVPYHGHDQSVMLTVPPLAVVIYEPDGETSAVPEP